jgi:hypothetical protein
MRWIGQASPGRPRSTIDDSGRQMPEPQRAGHQQFGGQRPSSRPRGMLSGSPAQGARRSEPWLQPREIQQRPGHVTSPGKSPA